MHETTPKKCDQCEATCPGHRWGVIRAGKEGWFFGKDGKAYCPDHGPAWVAEWRGKRST